MAARFAIAFRSLGGVDPVAVRQAQDAGRPAFAYSRAVQAALRAGFTALGGFTLR